MLSVSSKRQTNWCDKSNVDKSKHILNYLCIRRRQMETEMCRSNCVEKWEMILITRAMRTRPFHRHPPPQPHTAVWEQYTHRALPNPSVCRNSHNMRHAAYCICVYTHESGVRSHAGLIESTLFLFWQFECRELEYSPQNISRILSSFEKRKLPPRDLVKHTVAVGWKMWFEHTQRDNLPYTYAAEAVKINSIRIHAIFHRSNFW